MNRAFYIDENGGQTQVHLLKFLDAEMPEFCPKKNCIGTLRNGNADGVLVCDVCNYQAFNEI